MTDETEQIVRADEAEGEGFAQLLHVEWTKFRTTRGWVIGMAVAGLVIVSLGLLFAAGCRTSFEGPDGQIPPVPLCRWGRAAKR